MQHLLKTVETYRVATEAEAKQIIEEAKKNRNYSLIKYLSEYKSQKVKGEIVDEWYRVTLTKSFNEEKDPACDVSINYNVSEGVFPEPVRTEDEEEETDEL